MLHDINSIEFYSATTDMWSSVNMIPTGATQYDASVSAILLVLKFLDDDVCNVGEDDTTLTLQSPRLFG